MHFNALSRAAFLLASSLLLNACGHTISIENYNKLQIRCV